MRLGRGFRRAVLAVLETRGAPWIMRGSVIRLVSSFAGAARWLVRAIRLNDSLHTSGDDSAVVGGHILLTAAAWREEGGVGCAP